MDSILNSLQAYGERYGWDRDHYLSVYDRIRAEGIEFDRWWGKRVRNTATHEFVQAHVSFFDVVELSLGRFGRSKDLVRRRHIASLPPTIGAIHQACGKLVWASEKIVRLWHSNDRDYWDWNIDTDDVIFRYPRAEHGDPHGEYDLGRLYLEGHFVPRDRDMAILWLRRSAEKGFKHAAKLLDALGQ